MIKYIHSLTKDKKKGIVADFLRLILLLLSFIYTLIILFTRAVYRLRILKPARLNCKVISVGNVTCGGTGKTPFVNMLAKHLSQKGEKVAILIRGYKRKIRTTQVKAWASRSEIRNAENMGDEGYLLAKDTGVPVLVGRNRIKTGRQAQDRYNVDTIILDDAFQHWRLKRDLDIVLINTADPFGNNKIIPRGILREPVSSLRRADILVLAKTNLTQDTAGLKNRLKALNPKAMVIEARHKPAYLYELSGKRVELSSVKDEDVCIFSAIADPYSFHKLILDLGAKIKLKFEFSDHYNYRRQDLDKILNQCSRLGVTKVITTEKDGVKLSPSYFSKQVQLLILKIELEITKNEQEFYSRLSSI